MRSAEIFAFLCLVALNSAYTWGEHRVRVGDGLIPERNPIIKNHMYVPTDTREDYERRRHNTSYFVPTEYELTPEQKKAVEPGEFVDYAHQLNEIYSVWNRKPILCIVSNTK